MMTKLCEMVMECLAIKGMDRLVLYGWAAQLEEANDMVYASKETVADFIGVSTDTVLRRTQALIKSGWLIETGEQKQWEFARTPVRIINVPVIAGLVEAQRPRAEKVLAHFAALPQAPPQKAPPHFAAQGSSGSRFIGLDVLSSSSPCGAVDTGVPPVAVSTSKEVEQTENREPRTVEPKPKPTPHGQRKSCPECGEPLQRDVNHFLNCKVANAMDKEVKLDDEFGDDWGYDGKPLVPQGVEARQKVETPGKNSEIGLAETVSLAQAPHAPPCIRCKKSPRRNPTSDYCTVCWDQKRTTTGIIRDEVRPTGINP